MLTELSALKLFFVSSEKFSNPANSVEIGTHLKELVRLSKVARHDPVLSTENFKFSGHVLEDHITDTERVFKQGNKAFARWKLAATASVCMECHTQIPTNNRYFIDFKDYKMFSSPFDQAEFLFATRAFEQAFEIYDTIIVSYPENRMPLSSVEASLERQLTYFTRIKRSPEDGLIKMKHHLANKDLLGYLQQNIKTWIAQFEKWQGQKTPDPSTATDKQIIAFAKNNVETKWTSSSMQANSPGLINYMRVSGVLYQYLKLHPNTRSTPEILYWLAVCERSISDNFFYSLADLYLKECVIKYPKSAAAKKCLHEYELETLASYTGSAGLELPADVRNDLLDMKKLIESKPKVKIN